MKSASLAFLSLAFIAICAFTTKPLTGFVKASVNGTQMQFSDVNAQLSAGHHAHSLELAAFTANKKDRIMITIDAMNDKTIEAGSYNFTTGNNDIIVNVIYNKPGTEESYAITSGNVTITSMNNGQVKGSFAGTLQSADKKELTIKDGSFQLPYVQQ